MAGAQLNAAHKASSSFRWAMSSYVGRSLYRFVSVRIANYRVHSSSFGTSLFLLLACQYPVNPMLKSTRNRGFQPLRPSRSCGGRPERRLLIETGDKAGEIKAAKRVGNRSRHEDKILGNTHCHSSAIRFPP
jgi:hypothetical protein